MKPEDVKKLISEGKVSAKVVEHKASGKTSEMAANVMNIPLDMIAKTIIFVKEGRFVAVMTLGNLRVNIKLIPDFRGAKLASADELRALLGKEPGEVCPLEIPKEVPFFIDEKVAEKDVVMSSAGTKYAGLRISPKELLRITHARVIKVSY